MNSKTLLQIAKDHGSPIYVYNSEKIVSQYKRLKQAFNKVKQVKINYAVKALSNLSLKLLNMCFVFFFWKHKYKKLPWFLE